jgi:NADH:ubiquinone oxidoreductase subunit K
MTVTLVLFLALVLFVVAGFGLAIQRSVWLACMAFGLALVTLDAVWPHFGLH